MIAASLAAHSPRAVREALLARGWDASRADAAATGLEPVAILVQGLPEDALEALVRLRGRLGFDLLSGEGWALLAGSRSRLAALTRPDVVGDAMVSLAQAIGGALPAAAADAWLTARGPLPLDRPVLAGILNVTPDSFSDGGRYPDLASAVAHAERMIAAGALVIDVGGESTRPGASPVAAADERARVVPVVEALAGRHPGVFLSVDTVKAEVAQAALEAGAAIVNDVSALRLDPRMAALVRDTGAGVVLMHSRGDVATMASTDLAAYGDDPVGTIIGELGERVERARGDGIPDAAIVVDPGFGFAKTADQNLRLLDRLADLAVLGPPVMVGPSRKRFLGAATGAPPEDRDRVTAAACLMARERGARLFRVHEVAAVREALALAAAVRGEPAP